MAGAEVTPAPATAFLAVGLMLCMVLAVVLPMAALQKVFGRQHIREVED